MGLVYYLSTTRQAVTSRLSAGLTAIFSSSQLVRVKQHLEAPPRRSCGGARCVSSGVSANMSKFEEDKRRCLGLSLEERRKRYKCGSKFATLQTIAPWPDYYKMNRLAVDKMRLSDSSVAKILQGSCYKVDADLNRKVSVFVGDITTLEVDAIVNAANNTLRGGGGVDGAIHRAAGYSLLNECQSLNGCDTGDAKITGGYSLPARYVIHTVGPMGELPSVLESCYRRALQLAIENNVRTVAFPCISTGVYGYPNESAVRVVLPIVRTMLESHKDKFDRIIFCLFLSVDIDFYHRYLPVFFPLP
ncbi:macro domain-containing protein PG1779 [Procambarus clarkii]|uniref:macro domain-containing protein PG1779 n=1 Tax=Procambarus clarkii TaxID=6728 RepID=UPI001E6780E1|nr:macro domain-containing protein CT2219-like [Procambarus clarkii]